MRIVVDGLPLLGEAGIGTYLRDLLSHMANQDGQHELRLFFRGFRAETRRRAARLLSDPAFARFQAQTTWLPNRLLEWCWTDRSLHMPLTEAWLGRPDLFLSTTYFAPLLKGPAVALIAYDLIKIRLPQLFSEKQLVGVRIRRTIECADVIIAISECTKRDFVEIMNADPGRIQVIYPGVDSRFGPTASEEKLKNVLARYGLHKPYLLYVGSLGPHKNVGALLRVFRRLKHAHHIPHQLVLCGPTQWGPEVVTAMQDLIATGDCKLLDYIPGSDLPFIYHGAEVFAFLSLYEGFGMPPLEAMACGVPVVVSNAGSLPEVVGDAGLLVPPTDDEAIEHALYRVLTDSELRQELRRRGFLQAAKFSWPETARQTLAVFNRVCGVS